MKSILITGGLGFIGSNFINRIFYEHDYNIYNVDLKTYAANYDNIPDEINRSGRYFLSLYDINCTSDIKRLVQHNNINYIVNIAAETHVDNSIDNSAPFVHSNINGTHSLLSLLHDCPSIEKYVQVSTDEVYGSLTEQDDAFTEQSPVRPNSPYSASKASADMLCRSFYETYDFPIMITRCSNNYGPNQHQEKLIPQMIHRAKTGKTLPVYGDGRNIRDWIHVSDHCSGIDAVLHQGSPGEVYNIGGENEMRNINIVRSIMKELNLEESRIEYVNDRLGHDWRYAIDNSKMCNDLNWKPTKIFKQELRKLIHTC